MSDDLRGDLQALAAQVQVAPLDLLTLRRVARRYRRNRRTVVLAPLALALAAVLIAAPLLRPAGTETLAPAQPAADEPYRVSVTSVALWPLLNGVPTDPRAQDRVRPRSLVVAADPGPVDVASPTVLTLRWSSIRAEPQPAPQLSSGREFTADGGGGVVGLTGDGCDSRWGPTGDREQPTCPAPQATSMAAYGTTTTSVLVFPAVTSGRVAAGTYRAFLRDTGGGQVRLVLTVTGARLAAVPRPADVRAALLTVADQQAAAAGDSARRVVALRTDRAGVSRLTGADPGPAAGKDLWLLEVTGRDYRCGPTCFSALPAPAGSALPGPAGSDLAAPAGSVLTLLLAAVDLKIIGTGVRTAPLGLDLLGGDVLRG